MMAVEPKHLGAN